MWSDAAVGHLPCVDPSLIDFVHDHYIASVVRIRQFDDDQLLGWEPAVLASRLAEPIVDSMRYATQETLRSLRSSQLTRLGRSLRSLAPGHAEPPSRQSDATS